MRTFYVLLIFIFLTLLPCRVNGQDFSGDYEKRFYSGDFSEDSEYFEYIKSIYSPMILSRFYIFKENIKEWTSVSGSINFVSLINKDEEKKVNVLGEVAVATSVKNQNRWRYNIRAKTGLYFGGANFCLSRILTPNLEFSIENEINNLGYISLVKLKGTFNLGKLFEGF